MAEKGSIKKDLIEADLIKKGSIKKDLIEADSIEKGSVKKDLIEKNSIDLHSADINYLVKKICESQKFLRHHLDDFDILIDFLRIIVTLQFAISIPPMHNNRKSTEEDLKISQISATVKFTNLNINNPMSMNLYTKKETPLFPSTCRQNSNNYIAPIKLSAVLKLIAYDEKGNIYKTFEDEVKDFDLATIPIMVRSKYCNTYNVRDSVEGLYAIQEDPADEGAYFIMEGNEYYIMNSENIKFNVPYIYIAMNVMSKEKAWLELISKPGDSFENSHQVYIRLDKNNSITIEIKSLVESLYIPFYMLFRMLDITIDKDIIDFIIMSDENDQVNMQLRTMLDAAYIAKIDSRIESMHWIYDPNTIRLKMGELVRTEGKYKKELGDITNPELQHRLIADVMFKLDHLFLPHMGDTPNSRVPKCRYLGYLIRRLLLVNIGIAEPTNRDAYTNKRIHAAGVTLAKAFKSQFNLVVVQKIKFELIKMFDSTSFSNIKLQNILNLVNKKSLEKGLAKLITSSEETITMSPGITVQNRVSSQMVIRKNGFNPIVSARNIEGADIISKQSGRSEMSKEVQPPQHGYICSFASKDTGPKVGSSKEMTITTIITPIHNGITFAIMDIINKDDLFISLDKVLSKDINKLKLAKLFLNGNWIGFTNKPYLFVQKYREFRRINKIDKYATIYWDELLDEIHFWLDYGRLVRPLLIMDNNFFDVVDSEFQGATEVKFTQSLRLTKDHIENLRNGKIDFNKLVEMGIIEYISTEEQLNCYIAKSIEEAYDEKGNIRKIFTHCEMPQTTCGLSTLVGLYLDHNAPTRTTYETNQIKQTSGFYSFGWPWRLDKNSSYQINCENPLIRTLVNDFAGKMGTNATVAYLCEGDGQEDSAIMNESSISMGMFYVSYITHYTSKLESGEVVRIPSIDDTLEIKKKSSYSKLNDKGFVEPGTIINKDDVIISKSALISSSQDNRSRTGRQYKYIDRSVVYKNDEPVRVEQLTKTIPSMTSDGKKFVYVKTISELPVMVGDKFSTRSGNKSIISKLLPSVDMMITASGIPITYIANPQTITSRMVVSQLIEGKISKLCAQKAMCREGTAYVPINMDEINAELQQFGINLASKEQVYCGKTGMAVDSLIVVCPTYLQRLQKYAIKEGYTVQTGPKDALTGQPVSGGRNTGGGGRFGEMEVCVLATHGSMSIMNEIMFKNSDGLTVYMCRKCGGRADVSIEKQVFKCKVCRAYCDIVAVDSCKASNLFMTELDAMNISMKANF
jgi:DNA-directed RNA polymerase beta subunit